MITCLFLAITKGSLSYTLPAWPNQSTKCHLLKSLYLHKHEITQINFAQIQHPNYTDNVFPSPCYSTKIVVNVTTRTKITKEHKTHYFY